MLKAMCDNRLLAPIGYGRGRSYSVYRKKLTKGELADANVALPESNVALPELNVALPKIKVKKKLTKEEWIQLISDYCTEWKSVEEISIYFERNNKYMRDGVN